MNLLLAILAALLLVTPASASSSTMIMAPKSDVVMESYVVLIATSEVRAISSARSCGGHRELRTNARANGPCLRHLLRRRTGWRRRLQRRVCGEPRRLGPLRLQRQQICLSRGACLPWTPKGSASRLVR